MIGLIGWFFGLNQKNLSFLSPLLQKNSKSWFWISFRYIGFNWLPFGFASEPLWLLLPPLRMDIRFDFDCFFDFFVLRWMLFGFASEVFMIISSTVANSKPLTPLILVGFRFPPMYPRWPRKSRASVVAAVKAVSLLPLWMPRSLAFWCLAVGFPIQTFLPFRIDLSFAAPSLRLSFHYGPNGFFFWGSVTVIPADGFMFWPVTIAEEVILSTSD